MGLAQVTRATDVDLLRALVERHVALTGPRPFLSCGAQVAAGGGGVSVRHMNDRQPNIPSVG